MLERQITDPCSRGLHIEATHGLQKSFISNPTAATVGIRCREASPFGDCRRMHRSRDLVDVVLNEGLADRRDDLGIGCLSHYAVALG